MRKCFVNCMVYCVHKYEGWCQAFTCTCIRLYAREVCIVEMAMCPKWVLSCVGSAIAGPNKVTPDCRWWHGSRVMPPISSALRSKMCGSQRSESTSRGACQSEGNRKGAMRTRPSSTVPCLGHYHFCHGGCGGAGKKAWFSTLA